MTPTLFSTRRAICFTMALLLGAPLCRAASHREAQPSGFNVVLFSSGDRIAPGQTPEFVLKVQNATDSAVDVLYDPLSTHVVDSRLQKLRIAGAWTLDLIVDVEGEPGVMDLSGKVERVQAQIGRSTYALILFTPPHNRLPGKRMRVWAELRSPAGEVYRSNETSLRRSGDAATTTPSPTGN
jgi:hypothetical protein